MAGPLSWFRKHQRLMLGVFGVALMIVFTLSFGSGVDPIIDYLSGGASTSSSQDPVAATWTGGKLLNSQIRNLRQSRAMVNQLLSMAEYEASQRNGRPQVPRLPQAVSDEAMMELILLSREAERLGIRVTDNSILNFLQQFSGGTMQASEYLDLWERLTGNGERQLLFILRNELAAQKVRSMAWSGHRSTSPIQYWDYFNQLERYVSAEVMPIAVDDFVDKVPEPTESELQSLYDKYKDRYPVAGSSEPGFKRRMRRAFDSVKVDYNLFLQAEMEKITDTQVTEYYEANKDDFRESLPSSDLELGDDVVRDEAAGAAGDESKDELPADDDANAAMDATKGSATEDASTTTTDTESLKTDSVGTESAETEPPAVAEEPAAEADGDTKDGDTKDGDTKDGDTKDGDTKDGDTKDGDTKDGDTAETVEGATEAGKPGASFTPVPQDPDAPSAPAADQAVEPATDVAVEAEISEPMTTADADDEDIATSDGEAADGAIKPADGAETVEEAVAKEEEEEVKYRPVEDVTDTIKERLAAETAQKNFKNAISQIQSKMDKYYVRRELRKNKKGVAQPQMPDLAEIESPVPLNIQSIPLSNRFESAAYELGQAYDLEFDSQNIQQIPFSQSAYSDNLANYQPSVFPTGEAMTKFVYWVTSQEDAYTPKLDEIRSEVVRAWKIVKARDLAMGEAEKAAETARAKGTNLSEACAAPGRNFLETGEISWMSGGSIGLQAGGFPQPAAIPGIEFPGDELLQTLFRLRQGEVGVALDEPQSTVYVIRVNDESPDIEQRQQRFISEGINRPAVGFLARRDNQRVLSEWYQDLLESYDVTWTQDPSNREQ